MENSIQAFANFDCAGMMHLVQAFDELAALCMECAKNIDNFVLSLWLLNDLEVPRPIPRKIRSQKPRPDYKSKCKIRWLDIPNKIMQGRIRRYC